MKTTLAAAVVAIILVAALATFSLVRSQGPASSPAAEGSNQYPVCSTLLKTVVDQGYEVNTFLTTASPKLGQNLCVNVLLLNLDGRNLTQSTDTGIDVAYNITDSGGAVVFHKSCPAIPESLLVNSTGTPDTIVSGVTCEGFWNTSASVNGTALQPGKYVIRVQASIPYQYLSGFAVAYSDTSFTLEG